MFRRAVVPAVVAFAVVTAVGGALDGPGVAASAGVAIALVAVNFCVHGLSLAWASTVSIAAVMAVALGGFAARLVVMVTVMFALNTLSWFSPVAFGVTVVPATFLLLAFEARLVHRGLGSALQIPPDPAARAAATRVTSEVR